MVLAMFLTGLELADSFYRGPALVIVPDSRENNVWSIIKILYIDTSDDKNMNSMIKDPFFKLGSTIIQSTLVNGFNIHTKQVKRTFKFETSSEYWEAI
jgi:hypothetical protein